MLDVGLEPGRLLTVQYDVREGDQATIADHRDPAEAHAVLVLDPRTLWELVRARRRHLGDRKPTCRKPHRQHGDQDDTAPEPTTRRTAHLTTDYVQHRGPLPRTVAGTLSVQGPGCLTATAW